MSHFATSDEDGASMDSVYTYFSDPDNERLKRRIDGRAFNALNEVYALPSDEEEWSRLDKQHTAIVAALDSLFPAPEEVKALLTPQSGNVKRVLDLGCGTGIWATEMAKAYPHAEVIGVDLAPVPITEDIPPNCRFEVDDINLGLSHFRSQFDVIHARAIGFGIENTVRTLRDVEMCLKPGGIVIWIEADYDLYSGWPPIYKPPGSLENPSGSYIVRTVYEVRRAATKGGSDISNMERTLDEGLWSRNEHIDPDTCRTASIYLPVGDWLESDDPHMRQQLRYIGALLSQDIKLGTKASQSLFLKFGWSQRTLDGWFQKVEQECKHTTTGLRFRFAWGRRRAGPNLSAPPLPEPPPAPENFDQFPLYPYYEVYDSQEQALQATAIRNRGKDFDPLPPPHDSQE